MSEAMNEALDRPFTFDLLRDPDWQPTRENYQAMRDRAVALAREAERYREKLARAAFVAEHLHAMIDQDTWRASGGDDGQGHHEGDYRAKQLADEIKEWAALASVSGLDAGEAREVRSEP